MLGRVVGIMLIAATFCVAWVTPATRSDAARASAVPCADIIHYTKFPYRTGGYRLVLGSLSVPSAYLRQVVLTHDRPGLIGARRVLLFVPVPQPSRSPFREPGAVAPPSGGATPAVQSVP
jgi:hypothetical protein